MTYKKRGEEAYFPKLGFACKLKWSNVKHSQDWRKDTYVWRQDGGKKVQYKEGFVFKYYFKLRIHVGEDIPAFTKQVTKTCVYASRLSQRSPNHLRWGH